MIIKRLSHPDAKGIRSEKKREYQLVDSRQFDTMGENILQDCLMQLDARLQEYENTFEKELREVNRMQKQNIASFVPKKKFSDHEVSVA